MDIRTLCLATLIERDASGKDIRQALELSWAIGLVDTQLSAIASSLTRLAREGWIAEAPDSSTKRQKVYTLTAAGREAFLLTISAPNLNEEYSSPFLFAMLFSDILPRERVTTLIDNQLQLWRTRLAALEALAAAAAPGHEGAQVVYGFGASTLRAAVDYLATHRSRLEVIASNPVDGALTTQDAS